MASFKLIVGGLCVFLVSSQIPKFNLQTYNPARTGFCVAEDERFECMGGVWQKLKNVNEYQVELCGSGQETPYNMRVKTPKGNEEEVANGVCKVHEKMGIAQTLEFCCPTSKGECFSQKEMKKKLNDLAKKKHCLSQVNDYFKQAAKETACYQI
mmetsp:Transcript_2812/g.4063  ORF Transcript_2812/g.4063 Transcript_2812/m.4063 type:complete len:154 (-) Transcript_2812:961-1422(-)